MVLIGPRAGGLLERGDLLFDVQALFERLEDEAAALPGRNMLAQPCQQSFGKADRDLLESRWMEISAIFSRLLIVPEPMGTGQ